MLSDMGKLSEQLRQQARKHGLCDLWYREWSIDCTDQDLIDKFKKGIDFCIEHDWPSIDLMKRHFDADLLHRNLIYVDETVYLPDAPNGVYVLNGACTGVLQFKGFAAATVYVRHESSVTVVAEDFAKVFVRVYDEGEADVCDVGDAVVRVYDRR